MGYGRNPGEVTGNGATPFCGLPINRLRAKGSRGCLQEGAQNECLCKSRNLKKKGRLNNEKKKGKESRSQDVNITK